MCDIILELEEFMFWNKDNKKMTHLVVAEQDTNQSAQWEGRTNKMANKVNMHLDKATSEILK